MLDSCHQSQGIIPASSLSISSNALRNGLGHSTRIIRQEFRSLKSSCDSGSLICANCSFVIVIVSISIFLILIKNEAIKRQLRIKNLYWMEGGQFLIFTASDLHDVHPSERFYRKKEKDSATTVTLSQTISLQREQVLSLPIFLLKVFERSRPSACWPIQTCNCTRTRNRIPFQFFFIL